ncbi:MAG: hypothetical protein CMB80_01190 [Flammeovirgaceae bacterium]|nr:hypothetical protein [Flammeovirgaceae bacterium]
MEAKNNQPDNTLRKTRVVDTTTIEDMKEFLILAKARLALFQAMFPEPETQKYIWSGPDDVDPEKKTVQ